MTERERPAPLKTEKKPHLERRKNVIWAEHCGKERGSVFYSSIRRTSYYRGSKTGLEQEFQGFPFPVDRSVTGNEGSETGSGVL